MLVGVQLVGNIQLRVSEQIQVLASRLVALELLQDRAGGMALVHEQWHRRDAYLLAFSFAGPVEKRPR